MTETNECESGQNLSLIRANQLTRPLSGGTTCGKSPHRDASSSDAARVLQFKGSIFWGLLLLLSLSQFLSTRVILLFASKYSSGRDLVVSDGRSHNRCSLKTRKQPVRVFVQYAYSEGSRGDAMENLGFFLRNGVKASSDSHFDVHYGFTINGQCTSEACLIADKLARRSDACPTCTPKVSILHRANEGFDFGAHAAMLDSLDSKNLTFDAYIFLNCGVTGPFLPSYMPSDWHWVRTFTDKFCDKVGLVGTSIVCLPAEDAGGLGPKVEGFAFALSYRGLQAVRQRGTSFRQHQTKDDAILFGEYNLTKTILNEGYDIDCLLKAYQGIDWRDQSNWNCNNQQHPSRADSYHGVSIHPLEVVFHKAHWVDQPLVLGEYVTRYSRWQDEALKRLRLPH